ncbi:MAG: hypothetical protein M0R37_07870 [Bacteroidales bacterium]|nr:hypothetical protein [Bacteroidales bacterium]
MIDSKLQEVITNLVAICGSLSSTLDKQIALNVTTDWRLKRLEAIGRGEPIPEPPTEERKAN